MGAIAARGHRPVRRSSASAQARICATFQFACASRSVVCICTAPSPRVRFQKKSKTGVATPKHEIELIKNDSSEPRKITVLARRMGKTNMKTAHNKIPVLEGSGNVFADLELPDAADLQLKAELVRQLCRRIEAL